MSDQRLPSITLNLVLILRTYITGFSEMIKKFLCMPLDIKVLPHPLNSVHPLLLVHSKDSVLMEQHKCALFHMKDALMYKGQTTGQTRKHWLAEHQCATNAINGTCFFCLLHIYHMNIRVSKPMIKSVTKHCSKISTYKGLHSLLDSLILLEASVYKYI